MALGGGTFTSQDEILPGTYINFVSAAKASAQLSERGIAAMALELDWGAEQELFQVDARDFEKDCVRLFGYPVRHEKMRGLRELFPNIRKLYAYRLNSGVKARNAYAEARYGGIRGNDLKTVVRSHTQEQEGSALYEVLTFLDNTVVDVQTVASAAELEDNDYVVYDKRAELALNAGLPFTGGANGEPASAADHQAFLDKLENCSFHALGVVSDQEEVKALYIDFCRRMREEAGMKFQTVVFRQAADYEGVINVRNETSASGWPAASLVYWVTGVTAGCEVNKSNLNRRYDGSFPVKADASGRELEKAIEAGEFTLHLVGDELRVLQDVNSKVSVSEDKGEVFKDNQSVRVMDQIANDIAVLFQTKYLGVIPNDAAGRISLWSDIVKHHEKLQQIRAIENFHDYDVSVGQGESKKSVVVNDLITVVNAMAQIYMTVTVA